MDKEIVEKKLEQVAGGMNETDFSCYDAVTDKHRLKCKHKGKIRICPYGATGSQYYNCGDCKAERN